MSKYYQLARREAFDLIAETCPKIENEMKIHFPIEVLDQLSKIMDIVENHGTSPLRYALIQSIEERLEKETEIEALEDQISDLEDSIKIKDKEIDRLNSELNSIV